METLQDATVKICELKGEIIALQALLSSVIDALPRDAQIALPDAFEQQLELARVPWMNALASDHVLVGLEYMGDAIRSLLASQNR